MEFQQNLVWVTPLVIILLVLIAILQMLMEQTLKHYSQTLRVLILNIVKSRDWLKVVRTV